MSLGDEIAEKLMDECMDRLTKGVVDKGLEALGLAHNEPAVDLRPVLDALSQIMAQGSQLLEVLQKPTETAGNELCQRAATAISHGWFDDALRDATASVAQFPYRATPYLIGALAAIRLGDPARGMQLLVSCVKYSANGEREVGAVAALLGAGIAKATGLPQLSFQLLNSADEITQQSCPPVVAALASLAHDPLREDRLMSLWWADEGARTKVDIAAGWNKEIRSIPSVDVLPYAQSGSWFQPKAHVIVATVTRVVRARNELQKQVERLEHAVLKDIPANDRLDGVLRSRYGFKTPLYTTHSLKRTLMAVAQFDHPAVQPDKTFAYSEAKELSDLHTRLLATRRSALLLWDLLTIGLESPLSPTPLKSDWPNLGTASKQLLYRLCLPGAASTWPGSHEDSRRLVTLHHLYSEALAEILRETADGAVNELMAATKEYEAITERLHALTLMPLPANPWLTAASSN